MNDKKQTLEERLEALRNAYADQLPTKLDEAATLWSTLNNNEWDWNAAKDFHRYVHTLAGSAPTFGFNSVGQDARRIEQVLKEWIAKQETPSKEDCNDVSTMMLAFSVTQDETTESTIPAKTPPTR